MKSAKKVSFGRKRTVTKLEDSSFVSAKVLKKFERCLSVGSKERLDEYRRNLSITRGDNSLAYDYQIEQILKNYALDTAYVNRLISYLKGLVDEDGYKFSRNLKLYYKIEDAMRRFASPDYSRFVWNDQYEAAVEEMKLEFSKLNLKPLFYVSDSDIKDAVPKMDTHSGYTWILSGNKYKGENMDGIYSKYSSEEKLAIEKGSFSKPILIGFRTQASGEFDDYGNITGFCKHKLRVVSMIDLIQIIAELRFARPIQDYLSTVDYYAGGKSMDQIGRIISNYRVKNRNFIVLDYSSYDQTISSWLIDDAFAIMREAFHDLDPKVDELFNVIKHDFIVKNFIITEGVVRSVKGVPSGSMFTQIVDSIVNRLMILTYFKSLKAKCSMIIMGDDNAIFSNVEIDADHISSYILKNFGVQVNPEKSRAGVSLHDDVEFLSCFWSDLGRWRPPETLLSRLLYPERYRNYGATKETFYDVDGTQFDVEIKVDPELVVWSYILTYPLGMEKLINVRKFLSDYPIKNSIWMDYVGDSYLPGAIGYMRNYTRDRRRNKSRMSINFLKENQFAKIINFRNLKSEAA